MVSDVDLYGRWQAGRDAEAFAELVARHGGMVYGTCRRVLGNASDAEDVAQQCFLELAEARGAVRRSLGAWLHAMAVSRSQDRLRTDSRRRRRETRYAEELPHAVAPPVDDVAAVVDEAILGLPEEVRAAVVHRFLEGRTQQETAELLGISRSTAQYRIDKGVESIRRYLGRRGVSAAVATTALTKGFAETVPPTLTAALGKVAMAGGATMASAKAAAAVTAGGLLMTLKQAAIVGGVALVLAGLWYGMAPARPAPPAATPVETASAASAAAQEPTALPAATATAGAPAGPASTGDKAPDVRPAAAGPGTAVSGDAAQLRIAGQVFLSDGTPAAGARVVLTRGDTAQRKPSGSATADDQGRFAVEDVPAGQYNVTARGAKGGWAQERSVPAGTENLRLTLADTARISGRAYDRETGEGVAGALIAAIPTGGGELRAAIMGLFHTQNQISDAAGRFSFEVPAPAQYTIAAPESEEYIDEGWRDRPPFSVEPQQQLDNVDIPLRHGLVIQGTVYDTSGEPVEGADVQLLNQTLGSNSPQGTATTDAQGHYRLGKVQPGQAYLVRAAHADYGFVESQPLTLNPGEERDDVDLQFVEGHRVSGRLVTSDGEGVPGLRVWVTGAREGDFVAVPHTETVSGEDGAFSIAPLAAGEYTFTVDLARGPAGQYSTAIFRGASFTMPQDSDLDGIEVDLGPALEGFISGRLTGPKGEPVPGITVGAHSTNAHCFTQSGPDGTYRIEHLGSSERWAIEVFSGNGYAFDVRHNVAVNSQGVDFTLRRLGSVSGVVVDEATGNPVPAFEAREGQWDWAAFNAPDGSFTLNGIKSDAPQIEVRAQGYVSTTTDPIPLDGQGTASGIRIALKRGEGVRGVVVDAATGLPLEGARVRVFEGDPRSSWYAQGRGWSESDPVTNAEGAFTLYNLTPGQPANVFAWREGYAPTVLMGTTESELAIALGVGGTLQGVVTRAGAPLPNAYLNMARVAPEDGLLYETLVGTDTQGRFRVNHLPPGGYRLFCRTSLGGESPVWEGEAVVEEGKPTEIAVAVSSGPQS